MHIDGYKSRSRTSGGPRDASEAISKPLRWIRMPESMKLTFAEDGSLRIGHCDDVIGDGEIRARERVGCDKEGAEQQSSS